MEAAGELKAVKGLLIDQQFKLEGEVTTLGRHYNCDIVLDANAVSREHAVIRRQDDRYVLEDLGSRNGTFLNGRRVTARAPLENNDLIVICDMEFRFSAPLNLAAQCRRKAEQVVLDDHDDADSRFISRVDMASLSQAGQGRAKAEIAEMKVKALLDIGRSLGGTLELDEVLARLLDNLFWVFGQAERGYIVLVDERTGKLTPQAVKLRDETAEGKLRISRTIIHNVMTSGEAVLSADAANDSRFDASASIVNFEIHSMMCAPLLDSRGEAIGAIQIDATDFKQPFSEDDLDLLASVAVQAAVAIEKTKLHRIALQEAALDRELQVAQQVQMGFLPAEPPIVEGYDFFASYEPAKHLGGDYFDYVPLSGGKLAVALGDVSGKGAAAALLMAKLSAEVRFRLVSEANPIDVMRELNRCFCSSRWEDRFVTLILAVLSPEEHRMTIVNAGHMPPILRDADGNPRTLTTPVGLPVGIDEDWDYEEYVLDLQRSELIAFYTDGFPDAMNSQGQSYGDERLLASFAPDEPREAQTLGQRLLDKVHQHTGRQPQFDDRCITMIHRLR